MSHKEDGKNFFRQENFEESLTSYRAALLTAPETEKQILLSNIVACRLKIGGPAMAAAAVEEAKQVGEIKD
jgi:Tfp pilus assembly protein PilF